MPSKLSAFSQEDAVNLLVFSSEAKLVRNLLSPDLFDGINRVIVEKCFEYIDIYGCAPQDHIANLIEDKLIDPHEGPKYQDLLKSLFTVRENPNVQYIIDKLTEFVSDRKFENALYDAAQLSFTQNKTAEAKERMRHALDVDP